MSIKKDKYLRARGGSAHIIYVKCAKCTNKIFYYQKDGPGWLKRCYLNRIISPQSLKQLDEKAKSEKDFGNLTCSCGNLIGTPMTHKDGRLAFRLIRGSFTRRISRAKNC